MVKLSGPMMSMAASGTLADTITFSTWKGRPYARERVIPSNPRSYAQVGRRGMFKFLTQFWQNISTVGQATWQDRADQLVASPFNAFVSYNMANWHNFLAPTQYDPATRGDNVGTLDGNETAAWEENRIKFHVICDTLNDNLSILIFTSLTTGFDSSVATLIQANPITDAGTYDYFWTPPSVATWYANFRMTSANGVLGAESAELSAAP